MEPVAPAKSGSLKGKGSPVAMEPTALVKGKGKPVVMEPVALVTGSIESLRWNQLFLRSIIQRSAYFLTSFLHAKVKVNWLMLNLSLPQLYLFLDVQTSLQCYPASGRARRWCLKQEPLTKEG